MRLFARSHDVRDGDFARSAGEVRKFARFHRGKNVYVAPNPTSSIAGARHSAKDVTHWSYFLIDMDPVERKYDAREALDKALLWLGEWVGRDLSEPVIIDSGRGMQAWVRLDDVILTDEPSAMVKNFGAYGMEPMGRSIVRRAHGYWLKKLDEKLGVTFGCRIDTSVSDLPRVMRCPGTTNMKTARPARIVNMTTRVYKGLAQLLVTGTPERVLSDPEQVSLTPGQPWQAVKSHMTLSSQEYLLHGQAEPGRHKVMWHTARKFQELGVSRAEARKALRWANALQGEKEQLPQDQIEHALDTAYGR